MQINFPTMHIAGPAIAPTAGQGVVADEFRDVFDALKAAMGTGPATIVTQADHASDIDTVDDDHDPDAEPISPQIAAEPDNNEDADFLTPAPIDPLSDETVVIRPDRLPYATPDQRDAIQVAAGVVPSSGGLSRGPYDRVPPDIQPESDMAMRAWGDVPRKVSAPMQHVIPVSALPVPVSVSGAPDAIEPGVRTNVGAAPVIPVRHDSSPPFAATLPDAGPIVTDGQPLAPRADQREARVNAEIRAMVPKTRDFAPTTSVGLPDLDTASPVDPAPHMQIQRFHQGFGRAEPTQQPLVPMTQNTPDSVLAMMNAGPAPKAPISSRLQGNVAPTQAPDQLSSGQTALPQRVMVPTVTVAGQLVDLHGAGQPGTFDAVTAALAERHMPQAEPGAQPLVVQAAGSPVLPEGPQVTTEAARATHIARQIAPVIEKQPDGVTEIRLDPAELGRLRMSLHATDTTVTLAIQAERPDTADLMRRNLDGLVNELRNLGYAEVTIHLGSGGRDNHGGTAPAAPAVEMTGMLDAADSVAPFPEPTRAHAGALDLRL